MGGPDAFLYLHQVSTGLSPSFTTVPHVLLSDNTLSVLMNLTTYELSKCDC